QHAAASIGFNACISIHCDIPLPHDVDVCVLEIEHGASRLIGSKYEVLADGAVCSRCGKTHASAIVDRDIASCRHCRRGCETQLSAVLDRDTSCEAVRAAENNVAVPRSRDGQCSRSASFGDVAADREIARTINLERTTSL